MNKTNMQKTVFYEKSPGNRGYIKNMEVVGYHDLNKAIFL